jgi:hypothetical protein
MTIKLLTCVVELSQYLTVANAAGLDGDIHLVRSDLPQFKLEQFERSDGLGGGVCSDDHLLFPSRSFRGSRGWLPAGRLIHAVCSTLACQPIGR